MGLLMQAVLFLSFLAVAVDALASIHAHGAKLFDSNGNQFFVKGIAYQLAPSDPLMDTAQCSRDAALMRTLGTNSIRVYHVDPTADHSGCMSVFADAGIYVWIDLDTFTTWISQTSPAWTPSQFNAFAAVMDAFAPYDNVAGFFVGNEVINTASGSLAAPYIKAAAADMKAYRSSKGYRNFLIGYSAADIAELRPMLQNYLACGPASDSIEFFSLNSYEWCGDGTYESSGYSNLQAQASGYSVPIFFSETGCNVGGQRTFADQAAIFGPAMSNTWSGAMIYEWIQEANNYGLVTRGPGGTPTAIAPDFTNLANQWRALSPRGTPLAAYTPSHSTPACPVSTAAGWLVNGDPRLSTLGAGVASLQAPTRTSLNKLALSLTSTSSITRLPSSSIAASTAETYHSPLTITTTTPSPPSPPQLAHSSSTAAAAPRRARTHDLGALLCAGLAVAGAL